MDRVAQLSSAARSELFQETTARLGIARAAIVEKDFWVCWTLGRLFSLQTTHPAAYSAAHAGTQAHPDLVFKGGTSLSKVFGLIQRFSEDIDLSLDWRGLGFTGDRDPANATANRRRRTLLEELGEECERYLAAVLVPALRSDFESILGPGSVGTNQGSDHTAFQVPDQAPDQALDGRFRSGLSSESSSESWKLAVDPEEPQTVLFTYPPSLSEATYSEYGYLMPVVRLEFGARGEQWPAAMHVVTPFAAQVFPDQFTSQLTSQQAPVRVLSAERTFWEKATILHAWAHRGSLPTGVERGSRHYYDLAMLSQSPLRQRALDEIDLLTEVALHKERFYPAAWANYAAARPGTLRLVPDDAMVRALSADYSKMQELIFGDVPTVDQIMAELSDLEREINRIGTAS